MAVRLREAVLEQYRRISLFNSPYIAHRTGRAIDLYPGRDWVPSPVEGSVVHIERFRTPDRPRTVDHDILLVVDTGDLLARMLHVEPDVSVGDDIHIGDSIGRPVRTGYFDPWVSPHLHLEFRKLDADIRRARGSLPIELGIQPHGMFWNGKGTVIERGPTYAVLDRPVHPSPGEAFVAIGADQGGALDGGLTHYETGGRYGGSGRTVSLFGVQLGEIDEQATNGIERVTWEGRTFVANGQQLVGLSSVLTRDGTFGARLIGPPSTLRVGEDVRVRMEKPEDKAD